MSEVYVVKYVYDGDPVTVSAVMSVCTSKEKAKEHIKTIVDNNLAAFKKEGRQVEVEKKWNGFYYEIIETGDEWTDRHRYGCMKYDLDVLDLDSLKP